MSAISAKLEKRLCVRASVYFKSVWINSVHKSNQLIFLLNVIIYFDRLCINSILYISRANEPHTHHTRSREQVSLHVNAKNNKLIYSKLIDQVCNKFFFFFSLKCKYSHSCVLRVFTRLRCAFLSQKETKLNQKIVANYMIFDNDNDQKTHCLHYLNWDCVLKQKCSWFWLCNCQKWEIWTCIRIDTMSVFVEENEMFISSGHFLAWIAPNSNNNNSNSTTTNSNNYVGGALLAFIRLFAFLPWIVLCCECAIHSE